MNQTGHTYIVEDTIEHYIENRVLTWRPPLINSYEMRLHFHKKKTQRHCLSYNPYRIHAQYVNSYPHDVDRPEILRPLPNRCSQFNHVYIVPPILLELPQLIFGAAHNP